MGGQKGESLSLGGAGRIDFDIVFQGRRNRVLGIELQNFLKSSLPGFQVAEIELQLLGAALLLHKRFFTGINGEIHFFHIFLQPGGIGVIGNPFVAGPGHPSLTVLIPAIDGRKLFCMAEKLQRLLLAKLRPVQELLLVQVVDGSAVDDDDVADRGQRKNLLRNIILQAASGGDENSAFGSGALKDAPGMRGNDLSAVQKRSIQIESDKSDIHKKTSV